ncbi:MAG: chemotaxis protein CheW [bacterium]
MDTTGRKPEETEQQLVGFLLDNQEYGVGILQVQEIIRGREVTKVPRAPNFIEGVIDLRGIIIPIIDLRKRFDLKERPADESTRIIVVEVEGQTVGLIVDSVSEVLRVPADVISPPPPMTVGIDTDYIKGVARLAEGRLLIILDLDRILKPEEITALKEI